MARKYRTNESQKKSSSKSGVERGKSKRKPFYGKKNSSAASRNTSGDSSREYAPATTGSLNDISWYSRNPQLLLAAGSFPFPYRPGMEMDFGQTYPFKIPAIMALDWIPSFGRSYFSTDPASVAGKEIYGRVRAVYSGSLDADASDFMIYLGALDSVFAYIGYLKRMYRCLTVYSIENRALPDALLLAMGLTSHQADMLRSDKMRLWQGINELVLLSRKFKCPAVMDIFNRHYWMSDNVYADAPSLQAQLYMFVLTAVYKVKEPDGETQDFATLEMTPIPRFWSEEGSGLTQHQICDDLISFGRSLIQALDSWDDCYTISGYLQRAYEGVQSFAVAELLIDEVMTAQFVPEVLAQIENSRAVLPSTAPLTYTSADAAIYANMTVSQDVMTNAVIARNMLNFSTQKQTPLWVEATALKNVDGPLSKYPVFITLRSDAPTVADSVIATRLLAASQTTVSSASGSSDATVEIIADSGTEVPLRWRILAFGVNADKTTYDKFVNVPPIGWLSSFNGAPANIPAQLVAYIAQFDWHPVLMMAIPYGVDTQIVPMGDVHNATTITEDMLRNLNKVCFYSEFNSFGL